MRSLKIFLCGFVSTALFLSCDNDQDTASKELSPYAKNFLTLKLGSMSSNSMASASGFANAANESFSRISSQTDMSFGRVKKDSTDTEPGDTTYYPSPWITCAVITTTVNRDNSVTTIYDYGDGCEEGNEYFKYLMYGKYTYTYLYENEKVGSVYKDHYAGSYLAENYGGRYYWENDTSNWESNGASMYSGTSEYDTANQTYNGHYEYEGNDSYSYNDVTYAYSGKGKGSYDEKGSIIDLNDYSYSTADYSYETKVLAPLVTRYDCYNAYDKGGAELAYCFMQVYVSGREFVKYKQGDVEGSFEIDYGNGECDSKVTIIENGTRVELDLYSYYNREVTIN
jgi:hypothetical protein